MTVLDADDCKSCGACCCRNYNGSVGAVRPLELHEFPALIRNAMLEVDLLGDCWMAVRDDGERRCKMLVGVVGEEVRCNIYDQRPQACCDVLVGSDVCRVARVFAGID